MRAGFLHESADYHRRRRSRWIARTGLEPPRRHDHRVATAYTLVNDVVDSVSEATTFMNASSAAQADTSCTLDRGLHAGAGDVDDVAETGASR